MGHSPAFPEPKHFEDSSSLYADSAYMHAPQPQRAGRQLPQLDSEEESLPLRTTFDRPHSSDTPYDTSAPSSSSPNPKRLTASSSYPPRNFSRPTLSPPPVVQYTHPENLNASGYVSPGDLPSLNPQSVGRFSSPPLSQQVHHLPEESYDSFHTARTISPEPMTENDFTPPTQQSLSQQQPPAHNDRTLDGTRGQDLRLRNQQTNFGAALL